MAEVLSKLSSSQGKSTFLSKKCLNFKSVVLACCFRGSSDSFHAA